MQWKITAVAAAASLFFAGQGTLQAAGQPECDTGQSGNAPQQSYSGKTQDVTSKETLEPRRQADAEKYQHEGANAANAACEKHPAPAMR